MLLLPVFGVCVGQIFSLSSQSSLQFLVLLNNLSDFKLILSDFSIKLIKVLHTLS